MHYLLRMTGQYSHHLYWGIYHTGAPTFVCLCHTSLPLTSVTIDQSVPKLWNTGFAKQVAAHFPSVLKLPGTVGHYGLWLAHWFGLRWIAFSDFPAPSSDHTVHHNILSMQVAQLAVDLCWNLLLSVQKSDNRTNLAVGGWQYQCSHFLLALCSNYCSHKTETTLH